MAEILIFGGKLGFKMGKMMNDLRNYWFRNNWTGINNTENIDNIFNQNNVKCEKFKVDKGWKKLQNYFKIFLIIIFEKMNGMYLTLWLVFTILDFKILKNFVIFESGIVSNFRWKIKST
jgi:hypothetical protein